MHMLILFALVFSPPPTSKVVLNTGIAEAEFYLDETFVAATDQNGILTMEDFPAGTFKYTIKKRGYKTYNDTFTIHDGETKLLHPVLEKLEIPMVPEKQISQAPRRSKFAAKTQDVDGNARPTAKETAAISVQEPHSNKPAVAQPAPEAPRENPGGASLSLILVFVIAAGLLALCLWIWRRIRNAEPMHFPEAITDVDDLETPAGSLNRPELPFIEELKRREEQLEAGFVGNRPLHLESESMKEKEVVIVLPKDAYRYEEDK
jgi:hypothetical protein